MRNLFSELHEISKLYDLPDFVKSAEVESEDSVAALPSSAFADSDRRFPIHTKTACYLSNARFWNKNLREQSDDFEVGEALLKWASVWKIEAEVSSMVKQATHSMTEGLRDDQYALTYSDGTATVRSYPIDTPEHIELSAQNFYKDRACYPYAMRKVASERFLKAAAEQKAPLPNSGYFLRATGDVRGIDKEAFAHHLMNRAGHLRSTEFDSLVGPLASGAKSILSNGLDSDTFLKSAEMLDQLDIKTGLYRKYESSLPLPEEVSVDAFTKKASEVRTVKLASGSEIGLDVIKARGAAAFKALPEYDVMSHGRYDWEKAAKLLPTLNVKDANFFERLLDAQS